MIYFIFVRMSRTLNLLAVNDQIAYEESNCNLLLELNFV